MVVSMFILLLPNKRCCDVAIVRGLAIHCMLHFTSCVGIHLPMNENNFLICYAFYKFFCLKLLILLPQDCQRTLTRNFSCHKNFCSMNLVPCKQNLNLVSTNGFLWQENYSCDITFLLVQKNPQVHDFSKTFPVRFQYFLGRFSPPSRGISHPGFHHQEVLR